MLFSLMHLWKDILANQDQSLRRKSSLADIFSKSGSISPLEIIPPSHFLLIRMNPIERNHLWTSIPANQDAFPRWKSSLADFSSKSGCISPPEIIPLRHFLLIRMNLIERNHLWTSISANQDEFPPLKKRPQKSVPQKSAPQKACPAYETGRVHLTRNTIHSERNPME